MRASGRIRRLSRRRTCSFAQQHLAGLLLAGLLLASLTGMNCSGGGGSSGEDPADRLPKLILESIEPADGASEVSREVLLRVHFSRAVDRSTVSEQTLRLLREPSRDPVHGTFSFDEQDARVVFTPAPVSLAADASYRVEVDRSIRAADGGRLDLTLSRVPVPSRFRTLLEPDVTPPVFSSLERHAEGIGPHEIRLTWAPATDPESRTLPQEMAYVVYVGRPPAPVDVSTPHDQVDHGATETVVRELDPDTEYSLLVRARDEAGNEDDNEAIVTARTLAEATTVQVSILYTGDVGGNLEPCG